MYMCTWAVYGDKPLHSVSGINAYYKSTVVYIVTNDDLLPGDQLIFLSLESPLRAASEGCINSSDVCTEFTVPVSTDILEQRTDM